VNETLQAVLGLVGIIAVPVVIVLLFQLIHRQ
jgi:hypothetical protein